MTTITPRRIVLDYNRIKGYYQLKDSEGNRAWDLGQVKDAVTMNKITYEEFVKMARDEFETGVVTEEEFIAEMKDNVAKGLITEEDYKNITNEDYIA